MIANSLGAILATRYPFIHLSYQNKVLAPLPTSVCIATEKKA
jgi:hypothetical protein